MKRTGWILLMMCCTLVVQSQPWVALMEDRSVSFYDVQNAFNQHWGDAPYSRGLGYKQYKRWENFMEPRVYPHGNRPDGKVVLQALKDAKKLSSKSNSVWQAVGPTSWESQAWNPGLGRVTVIAVDPQNSETLYVGTPAGGLWRSIDNGGSWTPLTDHFMSMGVSGIAINPENSNEIYISTGDGNASDTYSLGVLKSVDGGATWQSTGLIHEVSENITCSKIMMHPLYHDTLWVGTSAGLYVTYNGGETWDRPITDRIRDIELNPANPDIVYASGDRLFRSENAGASFSAVTNGVPTTSEVNRLEIAVTPANPNYVYMVAGAASNSGFYGLYRSTDGGQSFELRSDSPNILTYAADGDGNGGQSWYDLAITASHTNAEVVLVGGINVWASTDGGTTWDIRSHWVWPSNIGYTHADIHTLEIYNGVLYCGSDGGIFRANSNLSAWTDLTEGLQISQYYKIAVSSTDPSLILTAAQDNGTNLFQGDGTYLHLLGGDGNMAAIDYSNHDVMYSAYPGGSFQISVNGGTSFESLVDGIEESGAWVTPFEIHPNDPDILFAAYENVWKRTGGAGWEPISDLPTVSTLRTLEVASANTDVIYTSTSSVLYRTTNGGQDWASISDGLPNLFITSVKTDPANADRVWVSFSGYSENQKVYFSPDGGESWTNESNNLPNVPVNCIAYGPGSDDGIYIGTDIGLFYKEAGLFNWVAYNEGLPNVIVNDIKFHAGTGTVLLGTYGRGVWSNINFNAAEVLPTPDFSTDEKLLCKGDATTFTNLSVNVSDNLVWTFEGGVPETSNELNPTVVYPNEGSYEVKLRVENAAGADSLIITNYIHVVDTIGGAVPFEEDFENVAEPTELYGWYRTSSGNQNWMINSETGYLSEQCVWVQNHNATPLTNYYLNSRSFDLSAADTALITMRVAYARRGASPLERLRIFTSTDCGETWDFKKTVNSNSSLPTAPPQESSFVPQGPDNWQLITVDNIPAEERTENFRFQLEFRSNEGNNIYVDDINLITDITIGTSDADQKYASINLFPNPSSGNTTLLVDLKTGGLVEADLRDALGRKVLQISKGYFTEGQHMMEFNISGLAPGIYAVRFAQDGSVTSRLLLIQ